MPPILRSHPKKPIPTHHLSEFTRGRIIGLHEPQMGYQQISDYLNIPLTTVKNTISKKELESKKRKGRGRHPKTTKSVVDAIV